ncbi:CCA tRNA nucleotidyltransferase [Leptolyngbya sp. AN03gr2]|uniref:CCA tRNA nucleotidyltransferase n=1 Tax=unclassified Leptolyngbya TaxID=2650499 RepID=UPI003D310963
MQIDPRIRALAEIFPCSLFLVGGAVRDLLRGNQPSDWDCASELRPFSVLIWAQMMGIKSIPTGLEHGTITLIWQQLKIEITTFRADRQCDGRYAQVEWANTIEDDLSRRDFTINAIAINLATQAVVDPYEGKDDILEKIIRFVGNPIERAQEDYLRLIRAARFASRFDFKIEASTAATCKQFADCITKQLSWERIRSEFEKAFEAGASQAFLEQLEQLELLNQLVSGKLPRTNAQTATDWWLTLFLAEPELSICEFCKKWKLPNRIKEGIQDLIAIRDALPAATRLSQVRLLKDQLKRISLAEGDRFWQIQHPLCNHPRLDETPWLTGKQLVELGLVPNVNFRLKLQQALINQMDRAEEEQTL